MTITGGSYYDPILQRKQQSQRGPTARQLRTELKVRLQSLQANVLKGKAPGPSILDLPLPHCFLPCTEDKLVQIPGRSGCEGSKTSTWWLAYGTCLVDTCGLIGLEDRYCNGHNPGLKVLGFARLSRLSR